MSYHEHDGEWDYCLCDEDEEGVPIRVPLNPRSKKVKERRRVPERRNSHDRRKAS
jgi:hypothetical protein